MDEKWQKSFPVSWDQFHRDSRALAWRLHEAGPFEAIVCITRGGLVPAAIVARELNVRMIETVSFGFLSASSPRESTTALKRALAGNSGWPLDYHSPTQRFLGS